MTPVQLGASHEEKIDGDKGLKLFVRSWQPAMAARGVVMIVPGFNAHSGQYAWVAEQLTAVGLAVYAIDLRGRGLSDGERFFVRELSDYVHDVEAMARLVKSREAGRPVFLLGHSAGGVVSCLYVLEHQRDLAGFVCESFAFQVPAPDLALAVLKGLSHIAPHARVLKLENADFSRDPAAVRMLNEDPLIANEVQPSQTVAAMVRADERLKHEFPKIQLPLLVMHGTADRATRPSGSQAFHAAAGSKDKTLKLYEGYFHDPLHDTGREQVMADVSAWLLARLPA